MAANVEGVVDRFREDGLTLAAYLAAALKQPQLFCRTPATIIGHIHCVIDMQREGLLTFPGQADAGPGETLRPLLAYLVKNPLFMTLSDDNYALRRTYARVTGDRPGGAALLRRTRRRVEQDLARALAAHVARDPLNPLCRCPED